MARILQYLDFNQGTSGASVKSSHSHKRLIDGLEAPRNSIEFLAETCQSYNVINEDIPYSCHLRNCSKPNLNSIGAPMKKLIDEEISNRATDISKKPSVIARLMGMDALPLDTNPINNRENRKDKKPIQKRDPMEGTSTSGMKASNEFIHYGDKRDLAQSSKETEWIRPQWRAHPQEEELQKFKKEFEAWQATKLQERSRNLDLESFGQQRFVDVVVPREQPSKYKGKDLMEISPRNIYHQEERSVSPTRIVILKPCPEMFFDLEESSVPSPEIIKRENNMEHFLEEVKNKLKLEIEGKSSTDKTDPKQIAKNIANQIRDSVVKDFNSTLTRSESARSYRNETQVDLDMRKLLSERLKNVLNKKEIDTVAPFNSQRRKVASRTIEEPVRTRPNYDIRRKGDKKLRYREERKSVVELETKYIRQGEFEKEQVSPRNLVRSLSAPVSGTAFVKLLSEDPHAVNGACLQRKHESSCHEHEFLRGGRNRKDAFDIRGKVSNLKQNLGLRKRLFGKRIQSADEQLMDGFIPTRLFVTTPSVVVNSGILQENFTEVPPSPASVCSSPPNEYEMCRGGYPSPVSPLEASFTNEQSLPQTQRETIPSNPTPSGLSLSAQVDQKQPYGLKTEGNPFKDETIEAENHEKRYVRTILVTAGLYDCGPIDEAFPRWDILTKPIPKWVLEQVEETSSRTNPDDVATPCNQDTSISHRMLFDLTNEMLPKVFQTPLTGSMFRKWFLGPARMPHGKKLLDSVWCRIERYISPLRDGPHSLDSLIYNDLNLSPWCGLCNEEIDELGIEMELEMVEELLDELVWDALMNVGEMTR